MKQFLRRNYFYPVYSEQFLIHMIMEYIEAQKQKDIWGNKPCDHPHLEKEYYVGAFLINYVCTQCGQEFSIPEKLERDLTRKKKQRIPA